VPWRVFFRKAGGGGLDFRNDPPFGYWKNRDVDSVEYQRILRAEWDGHSVGGRACSA
jgi:hypothetical protein